MSDEANTPKSECGKTKCQDCRQVVISLLCAIIVVAIYHFAVNCCKMRCPFGKNSCKPTPKYMLVPVADIPTVNAPGARMMREGGPGVPRTRRMRNSGNEERTPRGPRERKADAPAAAPAEAEPAEAAPAESAE